MLGVGVGDDSGTVGVRGGSGEGCKDSDVWLGIVAGVRVARTAYPEITTTLAAFPSLPSSLSSVLCLCDLLCC